MTKASAPGKIILSGEHAVVYGRPALAIPVTKVSARVEISDSNRPGIWIHAGDIQLHSELSSLPESHPLGVAIHKVLDHSSLPKTPQLAVSIKSNIPIASGMGSGAAISVALIRALAGHLQVTLSQDEVSNLAFEIEKIHHGTPSGIDNTVIVYAQPVYYLKGKPVEFFLPGGRFDLVIGYTGVPAPTRESVDTVRRLWEGDRTRWEKLFDQIGVITCAARGAIETARWEELGGLMDKNHALLQELTVSSPELDGLVHAARKNGALGAKLSGGGRGGNMIALVSQPALEQVESALLVAGARRVIRTSVASM